MEVVVTGIFELNTLVEHALGLKATLLSIYPIFDHHSQMSRGTFPILSSDPSCQETIKTPGETAGF